MTSVSSGTVASAGISGSCIYYIHTVGQTKAAQLLPQGLRKRLDRVYTYGVRRKRIAMANFRLQKKGYVVVLASVLWTTTVLQHAYVVHTTPSPEINKRLPPPQPPPPTPPTLCRVEPWMTVGRGVVVVVMRGLKTLRNMFLRTTFELIYSPIYIYIMYMHACVCVCVNVCPLSADLENLARRRVQRYHIITTNTT